MTAYSELRPLAVMSAPTLPSTRDLGPVNRLAYHGAVVSDYALRTGLATAVSGAALPDSLFRRGAHDRRELEFYAELAAHGDASKVFRPPPRTAVGSRPGRDHGLPGERVQILSFESGYQTLNPALSSSYARHPNNAVAHAQHWQHESGPRQTLLVIHGFGASPASFNAAFFSLEQFFADGWDILLYTLPFHGSRRDKLAPLNGLGLFSHGMPHLCEAILHAIHDIEILLDYLEERGTPRFGVTGLSLGGYISALLAAVDPRLDFAVPNSAVTWMPGLVDSWFPANLALAFGRRAVGVSRETLATALAIHSPLTYAPVIPRDRLMVIGGLGDRLAPPEQSLMLWEHWERPAVQWFPGSHVIHLGRDAYLGAMRDLMASRRSPAPSATGERAPGAQARPGAAGRNGGAPRRPRG